MLAPSWPVWRGETVVIVATGPSAKQENLELIRGRARVLAIKESWRLCPWADAVYGCDKPWWVHNRGLPQFAGLKFCGSPNVCRVYPGLKLVTPWPRADILTGETGVVGSGNRSGNGHSGFQAINLAVQFGVARIVIVGFDMRLDGGQHWHPHAPATQKKKDAGIMAEHRIALDACAPQFAALGVTVINASLESALQNYRKMSLVDAVTGDGDPRQG